MLSTEDRVARAKARAQGIRWRRRRTFCLLLVLGSGAALVFTLVFIRRWRS